MTDPIPTALPEPLYYRGHIAGLDVLRGAAVLAVVIHHAYWNTLDASHWHGLAAQWVGLTGLGHLGVHLFFVLSGFLITGILLDGKHKPRPARRFYLRRARRILPAYVVLLAVVWATHMVDWHYVLASLLFVVNMSRLVGARLTQFSSLWSLAVEEQFYLVWPQVLWRLKPKIVWRLMMISLVLPPVFRFILVVIGQDYYFKTWVNVDYLMYGAVVAWTLRSGALHAGNIRRITQRCYLVAAIGIALAVAIYAIAPANIWLAVTFQAVGRTPAMLLFVAMLLSCLIAHQATDPGRPSPTSGPIYRVRRLGASFWRLPRQSLIFLGYISYGLYLVHMLVFRLYDRYVPGTALGGFEHSFASLTVRALLCSASSVLLAWLSRVTLEEWFLRRNSAGAPPSDPNEFPADPVIEVSEVSRAAEVPRS